MRKFFVLLLVLASLLAACQPKVEQEATVPPLTREEVEIIAAQAAAAAVAGIEFPEPVIEVQVVVPEQEPADPVPVEPVVEPVVKPVVIGDCPLEDQGLRIEFLGNLKEDGFYKLSSEIKQLAEYASCNVLIEGRQTLNEEHHIWVFDPGAVWSLPLREGSLWVYPTDWNMADFSAEKPPIVSEFVTAKRHNQLQNDYDWAIFAHVGENTYVFPAGMDTPVVVLPNNADFDQPQPLAVQGIWDGSVFSASIGAEKATTIALLDKQLFSWVGARDNVVYKTVQAWLMPSSWSAAQVKAWAETQFPGQTLQEYAP